MEEVEIKIFQNIFELSEDKLNNFSSVDLGVAEGDLNKFSQNPIGKLIMGQVGKSYFKRFVIIDRGQNYIYIDDSCGHGYNKNGELLGFLFVIRINEENSHIEFSNLRFDDSDDSCEWKPISNNLKRLIELNDQRLYCRLWGKPDSK